jgi:hypothetical protein
VLVLVIFNDARNPFQITLDLHAFASTEASASAYRTSHTERLAPLGEIPIVDKKLAILAPVRSVTTLVISNAVARIGP